MFISHSFIKKPGTIIDKLDLLQGDPYKYFLNVSDCKSLLLIEQSLDWYYLDGAIQLFYHGNEIIGFRYWDLVDQCWLYLCDMVEEVDLNFKSERYFPDMPVPIKMTSVNQDLIHFQLDNNEWILPREAFKSAIFRGATNFYTSLINCFGSNHSHYEWWNAELNSIKNKVVK
jgi:hypothetical protein